MLVDTYPQNAESFRRGGNRAQLLSCRFIRRQCAQLRVVPNYHRSLFKLRLADSHPTLVKALGALRDPLGWGHFVHR
jgi:hypothetical protein